jgi:hypothetical protein
VGRNGEHGASCNETIKYNVILGLSYAKCSTAKLRRDRRLAQPHLPRGVRHIEANDRRATPVSQRTNVSLSNDLQENNYSSMHK